MSLENHIQACHDAKNRAMNIQILFVKDEAYITKLQTNNLEGMAFIERNNAWPNSSELSKIALRELSELPKNLVLGFIK